MKIKRWIGVLLCMLLCVGMLPTMAFAANEADTWDGTADTSWYDESETEFHLQTAEQLAGMATLINNDITYFKDAIVYLDNDLDLSGHEWISIGYGANTAQGSFQGTFDGQNHVIYNLYSHEGTKSGNPDNNLYRNGLFGSICNATVQNLGIENADIVIPADDTSTYGKGILVDWMKNSTVKNCHTTGSITGGAYVELYIGGLIGFLNGNNQISGSYSTAVITGNYDGGVYEESGTVMDYWDSLGGIVGASYSGYVTINDCWFGGKIIVNSIQAPVGGIIGYAEKTSLVNCLVATTEIGNDGLGNTCWLGYVTDTGAQNCYWPDGGASYGSCVYNETGGVSAGKAIQDFNDASLLEELQKNAASGVVWVEGIDHPTFSWDEQNILADYSAIEAAKSKVPEDLTIYTDETAGNLTKLLDSIDENLSKDQQSEVDAMAKAIEDAIAALEYKDADYQAVDAAIEKAKALNKDEYKDFSGVEAAIAAVVRGKDITEQAAVNEMAKAIENAIAALEYKNADYSKVDEAIAKADALNPDDYTNFSTVEAAINAVVRGKDITEQEKVDDMALAIENAIANLEKKPATGTDEDPSEPPADTDKPSSDQTGDTTSPVTGDDSNIALWIAVLFAAGAALTGTALYSRRRKYSE